MRLASKKEETPKVMKERRTKQKENFGIFPFTCKMIRWALTLHLLGSGGISHRSGYFAPRSDAWDRCDDTVLWSGAERRMDRRTGSRLRALAGLAAPAAPLALSCGVFCIISEPRREAKDQY